MSPRQLRVSACLAAALLFGWASSGLAQENRISPDELVRKVVTRELKAANAPGHYMYRMHKETPDGSITEEMIETRDWLIDRVVRRNGKPLGPEQKRKEDERLNRLLTNPEALQQERVEQERDERRVRELFKSMPHAFHYEYAGEQSSERGDKLVQLEFHPNPNFNPPTRELRVLEGMEGTMLINASADRIIRINARLVKRVNFVWGILAYLDPGGELLLEQRNVGAGRWQITKLAMRFTGKVLFFKTLNIDSTRTTSDFRRMPDDLTLKEGLELLKRQDQMEGGAASQPPGTEDRN